MLKIEKNMVTVGSLYAGVGGICQGFIDAGAKLSWANEYDKNACKTYRHNFSHDLIEGDIWKIDPSKLQKVDVLAGGFPCQPFSVAGYRKGFSDDRGNHFYRILEFVNALNKPKVVFLENVKNLKGHDNGKTFRIIEEAMKANGYSFHAEVLNSMDYGNIPQNRERIYIVCFRNEKNGENKYASHFEWPKALRLTKTVNDIIEDGKVEERFYYGKDKYMYKDLVKSMKKKDTVYQWRRLYVRENKSNVCPTLTANMGTGGHNVPLVVTSSGIRKLTPDECFLFQGFPKSYKLPKDVGISQLYKQAGNSVTVPVIRRIAEKILAAIEAGDSSSAANKSKLKAAAAS